MMEKGENLMGANNNNWCRKLDSDSVVKGRTIPSRDPLKQRIVAALKAATGATSITMVREDTQYSRQGLAPRYQAHCFRKMQQWDGEGWYEIELSAGCK